MSIIDPSVITTFELLAPQYRRFIDQCKSVNGGPSHYGTESKPGYHAHHIKPFSMGGTDEGNNCVWLTPVEHLRAHEYLAVTFGGMMAHIFVSMCGYAMYEATDRQKQLAATLSKKLYKDPAMLKIFTTPRDPDKKKRSKKKRRIPSGRKPATGFYGVGTNASSKKNPFNATIMITGESFSLGNYSDPERAAIDYDIALIQLERDHMANRRNFPDLTLSELRRLNMALRVPVIKPKPAPKPRVMSDEQKAAISKRMKGRVISDEHRAKISKSNKGRKVSPQTLEKLKARKLTDEHKEKIRVANTKLEIKTCPKCGYQGKEPYMTKYHFDNCRPKKEHLTCPHCGKSGLLSQIGKSHFDNCNQNPANFTPASCQCDWCNRWFASSVSLKTHKKICKLKPE